VAQIVDNLLTPCRKWNDNLDQAIGFGGIIGMVTGGVGYGIQRWLASRAAASSGANNAANGIRLKRHLASQQQMGESGRIIAGGKHSVPFRDAQRIVDTYGGSINEWVKKSSSAYTGVDGFKFETHWVENLVTGTRVEFKTKLIGWGFSQ
jgi:hypothetical protein